MAKRLLFALLLVFPAFYLGAAELGKEKEKEKAPEDYRDEEFSPALKALRRAEIIFFGSFPFSFFFTMEGYDLYRYFAHNRDPLYSPWPFQRYGGAPYSSTETVSVLVSALSLSLLVAVADYMIGRIHVRQHHSRPGP